MRQMNKLRHFMMNGWRKLLLLVLTPMLLTACSTLKTGTIVVDTACSAFTQITYSASQDSAQTIEEVQAHNRAYNSICLEPSLP